MYQSDCGNKTTYHHSFLQIYYHIVATHYIFSITFWWPSCSLTGLYDLVVTNVRWIHQLRLQICYCRFQFKYYADCISPRSIIFTWYVNGLLFDHNNLHAFCKSFFLFFSVDWDWSHYPTYPTPLFYPLKARFCLLSFSPKTWSPKTEKKFCNSFIIFIIICHY